MRLNPAALVAFAALPPAIEAEESELIVLPWNGAKGAVSLTFDDSDPSHLDVAIPELDRRGFKGTFFLITSKIARTADWKKAAQAGHEMGSHSVNHRGAGDLKTDADLEKEVDAAAKNLEQIFGRVPTSFAYPFAATSEPLKARVGKNHVLARGGGGQYYLAPVSEPDWLNLPSQATMTDTPQSTYEGWVDKAVQTGSWTIFMIHGLEGTPWGWQPISKKTFGELLDYMKRKDVWVAPFGDVGMYWMAQKIVNKAKLQPVAGGWRLSWKVPERFPPGTMLKIKIDSARHALYQKGAKLPDKDGVCSVRFDEREATLKSAGIAAARRARTASPQGNRAWTLTAEGTPRASPAPTVLP